MLIMDDHPRCGENMGNGFPGKSGRMEKFYREICPGKFQCLICGNIQEHSGSCSHCGMMLNSSKERTVPGP